MLDVTNVELFGDLRVDRLMARARPSWRGPLPDSEREKLSAAAAERIKSAADQVGLSSEALASCLPAIRIRSCAPGARIPLGASRLGGRPDLPKGRSWPLYDGRPMVFLGQFRLDELAAALPAEKLSSTGLVSVFADVDPEARFVSNQDGVHVEVVADDDLKRLPWPARLDPELRYSPALAFAEPTVSPPTALEEYATADVLKSFTELTVADGPAHQMFGYESTIQGTQAPEGYRLLLQMDGDSITGTSFGDGGRLYVWCAAGAELKCQVAALADMDCY
jgi:hypothetical protein